MPDKQWTIPVRNVLTEKDAQALMAENNRLRAELDAAKADIAMLIQKEVDANNG